MTGPSPSGGTESRTTPSRSNDLVFHLKEDLWGALVIARRELWANLKSLRTVVMVLLLALIMLGAAAGFASLSNQQSTPGGKETFLYAVIAMDPDAQLDDLVVFVHHDGTFKPIVGRNVSLAVESELDPSLRTRSDSRGLAVLRNLTAAFHILVVELRNDPDIAAGPGARPQGDVRSTDIFVHGGTWEYPALYLGAVATDLDDDNYNDDLVVWVVDNNATPAAGATVTLDGDANTTTQPTATADANGIARFEGLEKGDYLVLATDGGLTGGNQVALEGEQVDRGLFFIALENPDQVLNLVAQIAIGMLGPIYVIAICFDSISREKLSGSMDYLLTRPMGRRAVLAGKWAGAVGAMMIPITAVMLAGVAVIANASDKPPSGDVVAGFLVYTFLLISVFALLQMVFSTLAKTTGTAVLSGIGLWLFFFMLFDVILLVADYLSPLSDGMRATAAFFNPVSLYALSMSGVVDSELPYGIELWSPAVGLFAWLVVMMVVAMEVFRRRATE